MVFAGFCLDDIQKPFHQSFSVAILALCTVQFTSFAMRTTPAHLLSSPDKELRIARWDESLTPYSQDEFIAYYGPESGWKMWQDAVAYKDDAGNIRHVLVRIGDQSRWGLVDRISHESDLLAGMFSCDDDSPVLDLRTVIGYDLGLSMCTRILDYLCSYESDWWEREAAMAALDAADKLGLERLLSSIVCPRLQEKWGNSRSDGPKSDVRPQTASQDRITAKRRR